jgi:trimeric autotransporter adhesin
VGAQANTTGLRSTAVGADAEATAERSTALGAFAQADFANSTAVGDNAATTAANQVTLGGTGSSVRIGDIAASTAAQVGPVEAVTVDASGTLGTTPVVSVAQLGSSLRHISAVTDAKFDALQGRVVGLEDRMDNFDLRLDGVNAGIAAAVALGGVGIVPGKAISVSGNVSTYRGEQGFAASLAARVSDSFYLTGGVAASTEKGSATGRVGFMAGF